MEKVVSLFAPRNMRDFVMRFIGIMVAINLFDYTLSLVVPARLGMVHSTALTSLVAAPFVFFFLLVLRHQHDLQLQLRRLSETDHLTELANRRAFLSKAGGLTLGGDMVLMILDIDNFKSVNDRFGHDVGDRCLQLVSKRLERVVGGIGFVARIGGEEFGVLLPAGTRAQAEQIATTATAGFVSPPLGPMGLIERLHFSVGATHGKAGQQLTEVMCQADRALYAAKRGGRARLVFANSLPEANALPETVTHLARLEPRDPDPAPLRASLSHS